MKTEEELRSEKKKIEKIIKENPGLCNISDAVAQIEMLKWVLEE